MDYHHHIVTSFSPLLDILLEQEEHLERIVQLRQLIQTGEHFLEVSPITVNSVIRYVELQYTRVSEQVRLTNDLFEWVRINIEHGIEYENILKEANDLRPYPNCLAFEDIVNLVFAKELGGGAVYLTSEPEAIVQFVEDKNLGSEYKDLHIYDLYSVIQWLEENDLLPRPENYISVKTPAGKIIELRIDPNTKKYPTPVDFAYKLHTKIGHRCQGALVNGKKVSLDTPLQNNQVVQIIERSQGESPEWGWLTFVATKKAKEKIRKWFKERNIENGRRILKHEFNHQFSFNGETYRKVAQKLHCNNTLELLEKLGKNPANFIDRIKKEIELIYKQRGLNSYSYSHSLLESTPTILGFDPSQKIILSPCCLPLPDDGDILGILGEKNQQLLMRIHRQDCSNLTSIKSENLLLLAWNCQVCTVEVQVTIRNCPNILMIIAEKLTELFAQNITIFKVDGERNPAILEFYVLCSEKLQLDNLKIQLGELSNVLQIHFKHLYPGRAKFDEYIAR